MIARKLLPAIGAGTVLWISLATNASAEEQSGGVYGNRDDAIAFTQRESPEHTGIQVGSCLLPWGKDQWVYVLLPRSYRRGYIASFLPEPGHPPAWVDMGYLKIRHGRAEVTENLGGTGSTLALEGAAEWILRRPTRIERTYRAALSRRPTQHCPDSAELSDQGYKRNKGP